MTEPLDVWRVCGNDVNALKKNRGCTCHSHDPTPLHASEAVARLAKERADSPEVTRGGHPNDSSPSNPSWSGRTGR